MSRWTTDNIPDQSGRVALVTGANSGLGLDTARALAGAGAHVVLACRNADKAQAAAGVITAELPDARLDTLQLDLASLDAIRVAADKFCKRYQRLDILCNNAGVMGLPQGTTRDGFETVFGVNHLGHFALDGQLVDLLRATPGARVVTLSSFAAKRGRLPLDDLNWQRRRYSRGAAYAQSKLANQSFALELDRRLKARGIDACSVAVHPGYAATEITAARDAPPGFGRTLWVGMAKLGNRILAQPSERGALPTLYAATASRIRGGEYIGPDGPIEFRGYPTDVQPNPLAVDQDIAQRLWTLSEEMTGVSWNL